jgi:hypothetical protein
VASFSEDGNEPSGSIKRREFLDQLSDYELLFSRIVLHEFS